MLQTIGNICVALSSLVFLFPLQRVLHEYAGMYLSDDRWTTPILITLIPAWLLLMGGLLCMTVSGGFDSLLLSRPAIFAFSVAASVALAVVTFVFIGLYIRPGFMPRVIFTPGIYLAPLATGSIVVLSLNQKYAPGLPVNWLLWPWTIFAALSLILGTLFLGHKLINAGLGGLSAFARRVADARDSMPNDLAKIAPLDPQSDFAELLDLARPIRSRVVREAATARLRAYPAFVDELSAVLESQSASSALEYVHGATLTPEEQERLAIPTRTALENFISEISAANFISPERIKELRKWGRKTFPVIIAKFSSTKVDFSNVMPEFERSLRPDRDRQ